MGNPSGSRENYEKLRNRDHNWVARLGKTMTALSYHKLNYIVVGLTMGLIKVKLNRLHRKGIVVILNELQYNHNEYIIYILSLDHLI